MLPIGIMTLGLNCAMMAFRPVGPRRPSTGKNNTSTLPICKASGEGSVEGTSPKKQKRIPSEVHENTRFIPTTSGAEGLGKVAVPRMRVPAALLEPMPTAPRKTTGAFSKTSVLLAARFSCEIRTTLGVRFLGTDLEETPDAKGFVRIFVPRDVVSRKDWWPSQSNRVVFGRSGVSTGAGPAQPIRIRGTKAEKNSRSIPIRYQKAQMVSNCSD